MRVVVDYDLCEGNERCMNAAPEVFQLDDETGVVRLEMTTVPEELRAKVALACEKCPRGALRLEEA